MGEGESAAAAAREGHLFKAWMGDASGALAATLIALPQAMSLGLLAFAALGSTYAAFGVAGSLLASVLGNIVGAAGRSSATQILGARSSATVVFAGIVAAYAADPLLQDAQGIDAARVVTLAFGTVVAAGVLQIVFALTGLGRAVRFVPHPVAAGFMNGIALIILLSQIGPAVGASAGSSLSELLGKPSMLRPGALAAAASTLAAIFLAKRYVPRVPEALCGLFAGVLIHYLLAAQAPDAVGSLVGSLPPVSLEAAQLAPLVDFPWRTNAGAWAGLVLPNAFLLAIVISLDGLLASVAADTATHSHHDSGRLLMTQGFASVLAGAFGTLPPLANAHTRVANYQAGGRTAASILFHAGFMLLAVLGLAPLVSAIPIAALAGLMIYIAYSLVDRWSSDLIRRLGTGREHRGEIALNIAIVIAVALAFAFLNVMAAFALGVSATIVLLLAKLSGSPVRRVVDGTLRTSLKLRAAAAREALQPLARRIQVLELEGPIFFGTAEGLRAQVESLPQDARFVILDFRRVHEIDASGARVLQLIAHGAARRGARLLLSHVRDDEPNGRYLHALGMSRAVPPEQWFRDLDRAMEWAEDQLLDAARFEDAPELSLGQMSLFSDLGEEELSAVSSLLERREFGHGEVVFQEGDAGDRLYLIARGFVSVKVKLENDARAVRLATFSPGVFFGEIAMIEGQRRSSDAFAKGERVILYALTNAAFETLVRRYPDIGLKLHRNLARELAARVRTTSQALRALE